MLYFQLYEKVRNLKGMNHVQKITGKNVEILYLLSFMYDFHLLYYTSNICQFKLIS